MNQDELPVYEVEELSLEEAFTSLSENPVLKARLLETLEELQAQAA